MGIEVPEEGEITNGDLNYRDLIKYIDDGSDILEDWNEVQKVIN